MNTHSITTLVLPAVQPYRHTGVIRHPFTDGIR